ncbi:MAG: hypothetical protein QM679_02470 [Patulibacter sp.]
MSDAITPIDQALLPTAVRNGSQQRREDYQAALSFERLLVGQLTQQLSTSFGGLTGDDEAGGDAASQQLKQTLPGTLADALMAGGGIGLASQLDQLWHQGDADTTTNTSLTAVQAQASGGGATTGSGT